jgi:hypothetical protein
MSLINDALKRARQSQASTHPAATAPPLEPASHPPSRRLSMVCLVPVAAVLFFVLSFWFFALWWRSSRSTLSSATRATPAKTAVVSTWPTGVAPSKLVAQATAAPRPSVASKPTNIAGSSRLAGPLPSAKPPRATAKSTPSHGLAGAGDSRESSPNKAARDTATAKTSSTSVGTPHQAAQVKAAPTTTNSVAPALAAANAVSSGDPTVSQVSPSVSSMPRDESWPKTGMSSPLTSTASVPFPDLKLQAIFYRLSKASVLINGHTMFIGDEIEGAKLVGVDRYTARLAMNGQTNVLRLR